MKQFITVLRWVTVLPLAILAYWIVYLFSKLLYILFNYGNFSGFIIGLASAFAGGAAFISAGYLVAPNYKKHVAFVLGAVMLVIITISLTLLSINTTSNWLSIVGEGIVTLIGCAIAIISFTNKNR